MANSCKLVLKCTNQIIKEVDNGHCVSFTFNTFVGEKFSVIKNSMKHA